MASCPGKRKSAATCNSAVYRCKQCANIGCDQVHTDECTNQGFRCGTCLKCGTIELAQDLLRQQRLVMTPQLEQAIKILQLSLPELAAVVQNELDVNPDSAAIAKK
jgi:Sigma-54 factor, Activator interacting domain (AID)